MAMIFCRGCGKEIHESAPTCPHYGAPQGITSVVPPTRNVGKLIGMSIIWFFVFFIVGIIFIGVIVGAFNPQDAKAAGAKAGESLGGIISFVSMFLSVVLTINGKLPGTK